MREKVKKWTAISLGCLIYALGVALFLDPQNLASGGVTGIAILLNYVTKLNTGLLIILLNVPLFVLGAVFFGKSFTLSTLFSTILSSALIWLIGVIFKKYIPFTQSLLLSSLLGGALTGAGLGLIFRMGSTTGGTDIIVKILRKKFRHVKTGVISMVTDVVIVAAAAAVFKNFDLTCYTVASIVAFTLVFDRVLYGGNHAVITYIITSSEKAESVYERILNGLEVGATLIDGEGAFSGEGKKVIMCAVKNYMYPKLRDVVREADPTAFMIVSSAKEIYGEGYKNHTDEEL